MSCSEFRARVEGYADGSLPPADALTFERHLEECAACTALLEQLERKLEETAVLPRSLEPSADLWPDIRPRLAPRAGVRRRVALPGWALAAAAVLLIAASSGVTALLLQRPAGGDDVLVQAPGGVASMEASYASATSDLSAALERARARLAPETIAVIERNLAVIDTALAESRRALLNDPGNTALERLVIAAWEQKMDFLRRATALASES